MNKSQHRTLSLPITAVIQNNCLLMLLKTNELIPPLNNYKTHSLASPGSLSDKNQMMESSIETSVDAQGNSKGDKSQNLKKILTLFAIKMSLTIPRSPNN